MPEPLVDARALAYTYPGAATPSLRSIDLRLDPGEFVVLAGRSGSGKTTLLHACCGLVPHYHGGEVIGELEVVGRDVCDHGPADLGGEVGLVAQDPEAQVVGATVRGEIELPLEIRGEPATARARAVEEVALALAIPDLLGRATDTLSGGELQRVALAAALVGRPRLVLLDEPTSQLDPVSGDELVGLLRRLNEEWGTTVVLAEHRLERCLAAADRVLALDGGELAFDGSPEGFLAWAADADSALSTPGARLFDLAGLRPLPASVKSARAMLRERGLEPVPARTRDEPPSADRTRPALRAGWRRRPKLASSLSAAGLWVELDDGEAPRDVLRGVTLEIEPGERVALMGRNGAGKSTLMRAAAGLVEPVRGRIAAAGGCALLAQSPSDFIAHERVAEELPGPEGAAALDSVGLGWALERDPRDLSGGERQRLALAIVMAGRGAGEGPALVCLDEPTRGMDRARKADLGRQLGSLASTGSAILLATHDVEFAASFARRVVLLGEGRAIADGPVEEVLAGGWYFATEVARILGAGAPISPERGADMLQAKLARTSDEVAVTEAVPATPTAPPPGTPGREAEEVPEL
ncbi:MAG: ATP-binding cassette domain-containing protein [bacterium]